MAASDDELELRRLPQAYAAAVDRGDVAGLLALFTPDAVLSVERGGELSEEYRGQEQLPGILDRLAACELTLHEVVGHDLQLAGSRASGEVAGIAHHLTRRDGVEADDFVIYLRYRDAYRRDAGRWRFASRRLIVGWTELRRVRLPA